MQGLLETAGIVFREGLEAVLVIAALAVYLRKIESGRRVRWLYAGAALAAAMSGVAAWIFEVYYGGAHNDLIEAATMAVAAALMLYVSGWMWLRQNPRAWQASLRAHADRAATAGTMAGVTALAFLAVFREGAETILFLHVAANAAGGWTSGMLAGVAAALALLATIFYAIDRMSMRIPLRPVFIATSAFLFVMALRFVAGTVQELQEQQILPYDALALPDWLAALGVGVTLESVAAQLLIVLFAAAGAVALRLQPAATGTTPMARRS